MPKRRRDSTDAACAPTALALPLSDEELAERLIDGDVWAREALYRKYVQAVWGVSLRLTGNRADAEDVVQDTFAEALRDAPQLRDRRALRGWLIGIAVHQAHRRFRRRRLLRTLGLETSENVSFDHLASAHVPSEVLLDLMLLERALTSVPTANRMAWMLRFVEGCSLPEVAQYCACSLATAKRRIAAAQRYVDQYVQIEGAHD